MAKDEAKPQDKGKGKATEDVKQTNGTSEEASKDKDGKAGKKPGDLPEEELSEEDQKLKDELDMAEKAKGSYLDRMDFLGKSEQARVEGLREGRRK